MMIERLCCSLSEVLSKQVEGAASTVAVALQHQCNCIIQEIARNFATNEGTAMQVEDTKDPSVVLVTALLDAIPTQCRPTHIESIADLWNSNIITACALVWLSAKCISVLGGLSLDETFLPWMETHETECSRDVADLLSFVEGIVGVERVLVVACGYRVPMLECFSRRFSTDKPTR